MNSKKKFALSISLITYSAIALLSGISPAEQLKAMSMFGFIAGLGMLASNSIKLYAFRKSEDSEGALRAGRSLVISVFLIAIKPLVDGFGLTGYITGKKGTGLVSSSLNAEAKSEISGVVETVIEIICFATLVIGIILFVFSFAQLILALKNEDR